MNNNFTNHILSNYFALLPVELIAMIFVYLDFAFELLLILATEPWIVT